MSDESEIIKHRDDPGEWAEEPTTIDVAKSRSAMLSFRIPVEELELLDAKLSATGETLSQFIRSALVLRLHGTPVGPAIQITSGATRLSVRSHIFTGSRAEAAGSIVPDQAPNTASIA